MAGCLTCESVECVERNGVACKARSEMKQATSVVGSSMKKIAAELAKAAEADAFITAVTICMMKDGTLRFLVPDGSDLVVLAGLLEIGKLQIVDKFRTPPPMVTPVDPRTVRRQ